MTKRVTLILLIVLNVCLVQAQNSSGPFTAAPSSAPAGNNRSGGGTDDFNPPPDPVDTPFDRGIIFLLIIGTVYGVRRIGMKNNSYMKREVKRDVVAV